MGRSKAILLLLLLLVGLGFPLLISSEPRHAGRPLSYWVERYHSKGSDDAREAIRALGTNAIPLLLAELQCTPPQWLAPVRPVLSAVRPSFVHRMYERTWDRRDAAAFAFHALGAQGSPAVPRLIPLLSLNNRAPLALAYIGPTAVTPLAQAAESADLLTRQAAIRALGDMSNSAALPPLFRSVSDTNATIRRAAIIALGSQSSLAGEVVPVLVECTGDPDPSVQWRAIRALGNLGPAASSALPRLREIASSATETNNVQARRSIARILALKDEFQVSDCLPPFD